MQPIALLYARHDVGGGSTSFTVHLYRALQLAGVPVRLYRLANRPRKPKQLAGYTGVLCHYLTPEAAVETLPHLPTLLTAPEHSKHLPEPDLLRELIARGMRVVVHDPNEFKVFDHLQAPPVRPICIRPTMQHFYPDAVYIPHPYVREFAAWSGGNLLQRKPACSIARLTFVKRPKLLLAANRLLPRNLHIQFHGAENRLCTFAMRKEYPELTQGGYNLPLAWGVSARKASEYRLAVDMTYFPDDGGGSQYTFMEAWDAGAVNVVHEDWLRYPGEMKAGINCIAVATSEELAAAVKQSAKDVRQLQHISRLGWEHLRRMHDPATIAKKFYRELTQ